MQKVAKYSIAESLECKLKGFLNPFHAFSLVYMNVESGYYCTFYVFRLNWVKNSFKHQTLEMIYDDNYHAIYVDNEI